MAGVTSSGNWRWHRRRLLTGYLNLDLSVETSSAVGVLDQLDERVAKAITRATRKAAKWLVTHSVREMAKELGIKQAPLKSRFRVDFDGNNVHYLGNPSQNLSGVKVGKKQYDGAFYKAVYGNEEKVYIRAKRNAVLNHSVVRERRKSYPHWDHGFMTDNAGRFPVQVIGLPIEEVGEEILGRYEQRLNKRYREILDQELRYALEIEI